MLIKIVKKSKKIQPNIPLPMYEDREDSNLTVVNNNEANQKVNEDTNVNPVSSINENESVPQKLKRKCNEKLKEACKIWILPIGFVLTSVVHETIRFYLEYDSVQDDDPKKDRKKIVMILLFLLALIISFLVFVSGKMTEKNNNKKN